MTLKRLLSHLGLVWLLLVSIGITLCWGSTSLSLLMAIRLGLLHNLKWCLLPCAVTLLLCSLLLLCTQLWRQLMHSLGMLRMTN